MKNPSKAPVDPMFPPESPMEYSQLGPDDDDGEIIDGHPIMMLGDCLERLREVPDKSVRLVLADPPYGTTFVHWDKLIDFEKLWTEVNRVLVPGGATVMFGAQPFTSRLIMSNIRNYKYSWIWQKNNATGAMNVSTQPLRSTEDIVVFYRNLAVFHPQKKRLENPRVYRTAGTNSKLYRRPNGQPKPANLTKRLVWDTFPTDVLVCPHDRKGIFERHPTQKPVPLLRYLIRTYTNPGDMVLDFCMGSGSTGVAATMEGRLFTGIEKNPEYFEIAEQRYYATISDMVDSGIEVD